MKRLGLVNRLTVCIIGVVTIISIMVMWLLYIAAREKIQEEDLMGQEKDLKHVSELIWLYMEEGMPLEELYRLTDAPWADGSGKNAYRFVRSDSVKATEELLLKQNPDATILQQKVNGSPDSPVLMKVYSHDERLAPIKDTYKYMTVYTLIFLMLMGFAIYLAVKYASRSTVEQKVRLDSELEIAARIQNQMLPSGKIGSRLGDNVQVGSKIKPAREIGGDCYDVIKIGDSLHFIIADVSGKGIPAALFMARVTDLYITHAFGGKDPGEIAEAINARLCYNNATYMFVTAIIGRINLTTGVLEICSAGHDAPVVITEQGNAEFIDIDSDVPLGVVKRYPFKIHKLQLNPNNHLLLYTDGITEAENAKTVMFGKKRLIESVTGKCSYTPNELIDSVAHDVKAFIGNTEQSDDFTLLDIKILAFDKAHNSEEKSIRLNCELGELEKLLAFAEDMELPDKAMLALEEAVVNVFNYSGATFVEVAVSKSNERVEIVITDDGVAFDPTAQPVSQDDEPWIDENGFAKVGGEGINLIMTLMDEVAYERQNNNNVLTIIKSL